MIKIKEHDIPYLNMLEDILRDGEQKGDRTGTGTISIFGYQMKFDLSGGSIPLLTTKKMFTRGVIREILWYLRGDTNIKYLNDNNVHIWDEWADKYGDLGPVYGAQWRNWNNQGIDQIANVIESLKNNPNDRRMIVNSWNVGQLDQMALPPCHMMFQFWAHEGKLKCQLYQRSCDAFLGVPFNIVQYSILTHMIAHVTGHEAVEFIWTGGDVHIYNNHLEQVNEQLSRSHYESPRLILDKNVKNIDDFSFDDFEIVDYNSHSTIKAEVSI